MTTRAQINAHLDGTGTLTIGDRTESVQAENLSVCLAELLALVVSEAARRERPVEVFADLENNPPTGLRVHPDGEITEDSSILPSLFTGPAPTDAPHGAGTGGPEPIGDGVASRTRRRRQRRRTGAWVGAGAVVALVAATAVGAAVGDGQEPPVRGTTPSTTSPTPAATTTAPTAPPTTPPVAATWQATVSAQPETATWRLEVANADGPVVARVVLLRRAGAQKRVALITVPRRGVARVQLKNVDPGQWRWTVRPLAEDLPDLRGGVLVPPRAAPVRSPAPSQAPASTQTSPEPTPAPTQTTTQPIPQPQRPKPTRSGDGDRGGNGPGNGPIDPGKTDGPIDPND